MTNKEVIKLYAEKQPELIAEIFDDCYCIGCNEGRNPEYGNENFESIVPAFNNEWLDSEYDRNIFRERDVKNLLQGLTFDTLVYCTHCKHLLLTVDLNDVRISCPYEDCCDCTDIEDSKPLKDRYFYEAIEDISPEDSIVEMMLAAKKQMNIRKAFERRVKND